MKKLPMRFGFGRFPAIFIFLSILGLVTQSQAQQRFVIGDVQRDWVLNFDETFTGAGHFSNTGPNADQSDIYMDNSYIYVLDSVDSQVYRYPYVAAGVATSRSLRSGGVILAAPNAMTVYGDELWIATNANLYKYSLTAAFTGVTNYDAPNIYPLNTAAGNANASGLAADANYLYVLDPSDQRLYRYSRTAPGAATAGSVMRANGGAALNSTQMEGMALEGTVLRVTYDTSGNSGDIVYTFNDINTLFTTPATPVDANQSNALSGNVKNSRGIGVNPIPTLVSIARANPSPTNAASVAFTVTFSEAVTGVDTTDFQLAFTAGNFSVAPTIASVTGVGAVWTVNVNTGIGTGTIGLNFVDNDSVVDIGLIPIGGTNGTPANLTGPLYDFDNVPPVLNQVTVFSGLEVDVTFSEAVTAAAMTATNYSVSGSGKGTLANNPNSITSLGGSKYRLTWLAPNEMFINGNITITATAAIKDSIGNGNGSSATHNNGAIGIAPTVVSINRLTPSSQETNAATVVWRLVFSEPVLSSTVSSADFLVSVVGGSIIPAGVTGISGGDGTTFDISVGSGTGDGILRLDLMAGATVSDLAGNDYQSDFQSGEIYSFDKTPPAASAVVPDRLAMISSLPSVSVTFTEPVSGVAAANLAVNGSAATSVSGSNEGPYIFSGFAAPANGTVTVSLGSGSINDAVANPFAGDTWTYEKDSNALTVSLGSSANGGYSNSPFTVDVAFNKSVSDFVQGDVTVSNGSVTAFSGSAKSYSITITPSGQGIVTVDVNAGVAHDSFNNPNTASNTISATFDNIAPQVADITRSNPMNQKTSLSEVTWRVFLNEEVDPATVNANDFTISLIAGSIAAPTVTNVAPIDARTFDVTVDTGTGDGEMRLDLLNAATIKDLAGNDYNADFTSGDTYQIDKTLPYVTSITRENPAGQNVNVGSVIWRVNFSEPVSGVGANDFNLTVVGAGSIAGFSVSSVAAVTGQSYDVTVDTGTGDGILRLDVPASAEIADDAGNDIQGDYTSGDSYTIDRSSPSVSSISRLTPSAQETNASSVIWRAVFDEPVQNVDADDFSLTKVSGSLSGYFISSVNPVNSTTYDIAVDTGLGDGELGLGLLSNATINDLTGNGYFTDFTGETYLIDRSDPIVETLNPIDGAVIPALSSIEVTFVEPVTGLVAGDLVVAASPATVVTGSGAGPYIFSGFAAPADGPVSVVLAAGLVEDTVGNPFSGAGWSYTKNSSIIGATLSSATVADNSATNISPVLFMATFTEDVTAAGFAPTDISVTNGSVGVISGGPLEYTFEVAPSGQGAVAVSLPAGKVNAVAAPHNPNADSNIYTFTYDSIQPTVTNVNVVNGSSIDVTFSEAMDISAQTAASYTIGGNGRGTLSTNPNTVAFQGGNTYRLDWGSGEMLNGGDITIAVDAAARDLASNAIGSPNSGTHVAGAIGIAPTVTSVAVVDGQNVDITFSEDMDPGLVLNAASYTISGTGMGTLPLRPSEVSLQAGNTYRLKWNAGEMKTGGDITISVLGALKDIAGNEVGTPNSATHALAGIGIAPAVSSIGPARDATVAAMANVEITFTESVTGVAAGDLTINGSPATNVTGADGGPYVFSGFDELANGAVTVVFTPSATVDLAGNAALSDSWSYTKESSKVQVTLSAGEVSNGSFTKATLVIFTARFSAPVENFNSGDISVQNGMVTSFSKVSDTVFEFGVRSWLEDVITVQIPAGVATAKASNKPNVESNIIAYTHDETPPTALIEEVSPDPREAPCGILTIIFSEDVTGMDIVDLTLTRNGMPISLAGAAFVKVTAAQYTIDLSGCTSDDGEYVLMINAYGSNINDRAGNTLDQDIIETWRKGPIGFAAARNPWTLYE